MAENPSISYESVQAMNDYVLSRIPEKPKIGILCGTGLAQLADPIQEKIEIAYGDIPDFPECHVQGHESLLIFGKLHGVPVIFFKGRFHVYEGYSLDQIVLPVRLMSQLEVRTIIVTDVATGLNKDYAIGDVMLFKDHINFVGFNGTSPLKCSDERWGQIPKILYSQELRDKAREAFAKSSFQGTVHEGVYVCVGGPSSETTAEINMMKMLGGDTIGMSSVHEVLAAMQSGIKVVAWSMIGPDEDATEKNLQCLQEATEYLIMEFEPPEEVPEELPEEEEEEEEEPKKHKKSCACKRKNKEKELD